MHQLRTFRLSARFNHHLIHSRRKARAQSQDQAVEVVMIGEFGPTTSRTVDLDYEQLLMLEGQSGTRVKVIYGGVWLTEEGRLQDVFARTGEEVALQSHRVSILEGLGRTRLEVVEPVAVSRMKAVTRVIGKAARGLVRRARAFAAAPTWSPDVPRGTLAALAAVVGVAIPALVTVGIAAAGMTLGQLI
jgi:hypothetical protein